MSSSQHQPANKKRLGEMAEEKGLIDAHQLQDSLHYQERMDRQGQHFQLGEILTHKNYLTAAQVERLLDEQKKNKTRRLGNFEIHEKIGQGAMGVVFRARQISMDRDVALKILSPKFANDPEFIERFLKEARSAGQFHHENIVTALDVGYADPYYYFAMEHVQGLNLLEQLKERGPLPEREAMTYAQHMARALDHALDKNIIHRDIKPENIIVTKSGVAKLLDMGLACAAGEPDLHATGENRSRRAFGTPHYMSPEAAMGLDDMDTRADLYSLGCSLFHLLTGRTPFDAQSSHEVMVRQVNDPVPDIRTIKPELSTAAAKIVALLTAKDRNARYPSPKSLLEDLDAYLAGKTMPHAKVARGKTRANVASRQTTGPNNPVEGERTSGIPASLKTSGSLHWVILGGAVSILLVAVIFFTNSRRKETDNVVNRPVIQPDPVATETVKNSNADTKAGETKSPDTKLQVEDEDDTTPPAQRRAQSVYTAAKEVEARRPDDLRSIVDGYTQALHAASGTTLTAEVEVALKRATEKWQRALTQLLEKQEQDAIAALEAKDYARSNALLSESVVPANLKATTWRRQLEKVVNKRNEKAEALASDWLEAARAKAQPETTEKLEMALEALKSLLQMPASIAPSVTQGYRQELLWRRQLKEQAERSAAEALKKADEGLRIFWEIVLQVGAYVKADQFDQARQLLDLKSRDPRLRELTDKFAKERADLDVLALVRIQAMENLRSKSGEMVTLEQSGKAITGKVKPHPSNPQEVFLTSPGGPEFPFRTAHFQLKDLNAFWQPNGIKKPDELRFRGLLHIYLGDLRNGKEYLEKARSAGLKQTIQTDFDRLALLEEGMDEMLARVAWQRAEGLYADRKMSEALMAYRYFAQAHSNSRIHGLMKSTLAERISAADLALNPFHSGLKTQWYLGREPLDEQLVHESVSSAIDFNWGSGAPHASMPVDGFSIQWTGFVEITQPGQYTFVIQSDDGVRLWIDNKKLIDDWTERSARKQAKIKLSAGRYPLKLQYFDATGEAQCRLLWALPDATAESIVDSKSLFCRNSALTAP